MKILILIFAGVLMAHLTEGQTLKGKVMENKTDIMLSGIRVDNLSSHTNTFTDPHGNFLIKAQKGDLLCFSGLNYLADTVYLPNLKHLQVLLVLKHNQLEEVKINRAEVRGSFNAPAQTGLLGSHTVLYKEGGGLAIKIFDSHQGAKKRKQQQREINEQKEEQIDAVFNVSHLKGYLPITGQEFNNFIIKYRPDIKTFDRNDFNLVAYLNNCYKDFLKMPEDKRKSTSYFLLNGSGN
jgi:hypothetical protein